MTDGTCIFCRIVAGEVPAAVIAESPLAIAFLDLHPLAPGHAVVIPKMHVATLPELPPEHVGPLFQLAQEAARTLATTLGAPGMTYGINQGAVAGQTVPHLHVHLLPRFDGDGGGSMHRVVTNPPTPDQEARLTELTTP